MNSSHRVTAFPSRSFSLTLFLGNLQSDIWRPIEGFGEKLNILNEITWTREGEHHTPGPIMGRGEGGGIALGVIPDVNDELMGAAHQHGTSIHM